MNGRKLGLLHFTKTKGSKQDPNNFRPISVIGHNLKLFEKFFYCQIEIIFTISLFHYTFPVSLFA